MNPSRVRRQAIDPGLWKWRTCLSVEWKYPGAHINELEVLADILDVKNLDVTDSWFEDSNRNTYHGIHNHGGDGYSAVCFLEYDDQEHIPTQFVSSTLSAISNEAIIYSPSNVIEGDVIFFPSNTLHYTEPSESDKIRSILSWKAQNIEHRKI